MDTKLKSSSSRAFLLILVTICIASLAVLSQYPEWYSVGLQQGDRTFWWTEKMRWIAAWMILIAVTAWVYPLIPRIHDGVERFSRAPLEIPLLLLIFLLGYVYRYGQALIMGKYGMTDIFDFLFWSVVFGITYWTSSCLSPIYKAGPVKYVKERTLCGIILRKMGTVMIHIGKRGIRFIKRIVRSFTEIDLRKKNDRTVFKVTVLNFLILWLFCAVFRFTFPGLILYSVALFFLMSYVYRRVQKKYAILLKATNEIAQGNLETKIEEDLWIFHPFKAEMEKIQFGFKNAVEKEVKSRHMKTELITNVSHDLKTPLTAIITYVDLLKKEQEEEKRTEYIDILERKSLRLKSLIEDLFAISKVSSNNMNLNIMDVDVVDLLKQVQLELEDQIEEARLDFRCCYPSEKVLIPLDSQVTYRIFENLLVNVTKYAMPKTRVYVDVFQAGGKAVISMKNVSAEEISFKSDEITERFVRGDRSRNTEGSGLGLAIAKSFTEIQGGEFKIETEADLFKVEIRF